MVPGFFISRNARLDKAPSSGLTLLLFLNENHPSNTMAQPKRKQSKQRSRNRRGANRFKAPLLATDNTDGSAFLPHRVNPSNGMYRGRQVIEDEA